MNFFLKRTYFACWLLLAIYSSKDYLQKQRREREKATHTQKLQSMQNKKQKIKTRTKHNTKHKQLGEKF
jgi:hypothetical protein